MKHTPGPWQVIDRKPGPHDPNLINPNLARFWVGTMGNPAVGPTTIANVKVDGVRHDGLEVIEPLDCEANARLIAAAPELLEALIRLHQVAGDFKEDSLAAALDQAIFAISKAASAVSASSPASAYNNTDKKTRRS